jgi:hypothetical protein
MIFRNISLAAVLATYLIGQPETAFSAENAEFLNRQTTQGERPLSKEAIIKLRYFEVAVKQERAGQHDLASFNYHLAFSSDSKKSLPCKPVGVVIPKKVQTLLSQETWGIIFDMCGDRSNIYPVSTEFFYLLSNKIKEFKVKYLNQFHIIGFVHFVEKLPHLRQLSLENNKIGDAGAAALANGNLSGLTHLNLRNNNIGDEGGKSLARGNLFSLISLDLGHNNIGIVGAAFLSGYLEHNNLIALVNLNLTHQEFMRFLITKQQIPYECMVPYQHEISVKYRELHPFGIGHTTRYRQITEIRYKTETRYTEGLFPSRWNPAQWEIYLAPRETKSVLNNNLHWLNEYTEYYNEQIAQKNPE